MSTRVPPSRQNPPPQLPKAQPAPKAAGSQPLPKPGGPTTESLPEPDESAVNPEAQAWRGQDIDRSMELSRSAVEERMGESVLSERGEKEAAAHEAKEKQELHRPGGPVKKLQSEKVELKPLETSRKPLSGTPLGSGARLAAITQQNLLSGESATHERAPDAYSLLKGAREQGELFVEDALSSNHSEDRGDPELAAAVEECIAQCFGIRGILRIGPGRNDNQEPIIVVTTTHGLTEAALAKVPEKVHRFPTLVAIPFELLPLKRER